MSIRINRLDRHLIAAAAATAGAVAVQSANAALVYSGVVNINIPTSTAGVYLNVATGVTSGANTLSGWDLNPWGTTALSFFSSTTSGQTVATGMMGSGTVANALASGTVISSGSTFTTNVGVQTTSGLVFNSNNLFGFKFWHEGAGAFRYGWVRIALAGSATAQPRTIVDYAYDDAGGQVLAGIVPGPSGLAVLAMAAMGRSRRRR